MSVGCYAVLLGALIGRGFFLGEIDLRAALDLYREGLALGRRLGQRAQTLTLAINVGYTSFLVGDWDAALTELDAALADDLDRLDRVGILSNALIVRTCRGESIDAGLLELDALLADTSDISMQSMAGRPTRQSRAGRRSPGGGTFDLEPDRRCQRRVWAGGDLRGRAWRRLGRGCGRRPGGPRAPRRDGLPRSGRRGSADDTSGCCGGARGSDHRRDRAVSRRASSLGGLGMTWDGVLTAIDMATVLDPSEPAVREAARSARETLVRLRAQPFLERLDARLAEADAGGSVVRTTEWRDEVLQPGER